MVEPGGFDRYPAGTDVEHEWHVGVLQACPDAVKRRVGGRFVAGGGGRNPERTASKAHRLLDLALGEFGNVERHKSHWQQALVVSAEVGHRAIERTRPAIQHLRIMLELRK